MSQINPIVAELFVVKKPSGGKSVSALLEARISDLVQNHFPELNHQILSLSSDQALWLAQRLSSLGLVGERFNHLIQTAFQRAAMEESKFIELPDSVVMIQNIVEGAILEAELQDWLDQAEVQGDKDQAADKIRKAFYGRSCMLELEGLDLLTVPSAIGRLHWLNELYLSNNQIQKLPNSFGNLRQLTRIRLQNNLLQSLPASFDKLENLNCINLSNNALKEFPLVLSALRSLENLSLSFNTIVAIPEQIEQLENLGVLVLSYNKLGNLPITIGELDKLAVLDIGHNQFSQFPQVISNLENLQVLSLRNNQLIEIPESISALSKLTYMELQENPQLQHLPLSLGDLPRLQALFCAGTQVPDEIQASIIQSCQQRRALIGYKELPCRIEKWLGFAQSQLQLDQLTTPENQGGLSLAECGLLNDWLVHLEKTKDFAKNQVNLAHVVCDILHTLAEREDFRELFFEQIRFNLVHCGDRAAMSLNEIYCSMRIHNMAEDTPLAEKLKLLMGVSRTTALRTAIAGSLKHLQGTEESVEIFLYYEKSLEQELGLITATQAMLHPSIGNRLESCKKMLIQEVKENYVEHLLRLPQMIAIVKKDQEYQEKYQKLLKGLVEQQDDLDDKANNLSKDKYKKECQRLQNEFKKAVRDHVEAWLKKNGCETAFLSKL